MADGDQRAEPDATQLRLGFNLGTAFQPGDLVRVEGLRGTFRFVAARSDRGGDVAEVYGPVPVNRPVGRAPKMRSVAPERLRAEPGRR